MQDRSRLPEGPVVPADAGEAESQQLAAARRPEQCGPDARTILLFEEAQPRRPAGGGVPGHLVGGHRRSGGIRSVKARPGGAGPPGAACLGRTRASRSPCHVAGLRWRTFGPRLRAGGPASARTRRSRDAPFQIHDRRRAPVMPGQGLEANRSAGSIESPRHRPWIHVPGRRPLHRRGDTLHPRCPAGIPDRNATSPMC